MKTWSEPFVEELSVISTEDGVVPLGFELGNWTNDDGQWGGPSNPGTGGAS